jgi:two-component sensor histidine kinase
MGSKDPGLKLKQMNLTLLDQPTVGLPAEQEKELAMALLELLLNAVAPTAECQGNGDHDES